MKSHISATIEENVLQRARKYSIAENRTLSNVIELALAKLLENEINSSPLVTSASKYQGKFSRQETYERD